MDPPSREVKDLVETCQRAGDITTLSYHSGHHVFYTESGNQIYYKMARSQHWLDGVQKFSYSVTPRRFRWLITASIPPFGPLVLLTTGAAVKWNLRIWTAQEGFEHDLGEVERWYGGHEYRGPRSLQNAAEKQHGSGNDASWKSMVPASREHKDSEREALGRYSSDTSLSEPHSLGDESLDELESVSDEYSDTAFLRTSNYDDDSDGGTGHEGDSRSSNPSEDGVQRCNASKPTNHPPGSLSARKPRNAKQLAAERVGQIARADLGAKRSRAASSNLASPTRINAHLRAQTRPHGEASTGAQKGRHESNKPGVDHSRLKSLKSESSSAPSKPQDIAAVVNLESVRFCFYNANDEMVRAKPWSGCNTMARLFEHARIAKSIPRGIEVSTLAAIVGGGGDIEIMEKDQEDFNNLVQILEARSWFSTDIVVEIRGF